MGTPHAGADISLVATQWRRIFSAIALLPIGVVAIAIGRRRRNA